MPPIEKSLRSILVNNKDLKKIVSDVFIGEAPPNITESLKAYIVIFPEEQTPVDRNLSGRGFNTSMNMINVSCYGKEYEIADKVYRTALTIIEEAFNSSVIGIEYDTEFVGNNIKHVQRITTLLAEHHDV